MKDNIEKLHYSLFGHRPMTLIFYGEPPQDFKLRDMIASHSLGTMEGYGPTSPEEVQIAVGYLPILIVRYMHTFDKVVPARDLIGYIQRQQKLMIGDVRVEYHTFFGNKEAVNAIFDGFIERMTPRMGIGSISEHGGQLLYQLQPGDIFTIAAFAHEPIPGTRFVA